jgi:signal peptidase I
MFSGSTDSISEHAEPEVNDSTNWRKMVRDILETVALALILFLAINSISARIRVESISMEPTLYRGDFVLVDKISYRLGNPNRGDIVIFYYPVDPEQKYVKRVIGLPGDQIKISNGQLFVNGQRLSEPYLKAVPIYDGNWSVPEDSYFVLGDNRNRSNDSHNWGMLPRQNIIGRGLIIYWPVNHADLLIGDGSNG